MSWSEYKKQGQVLLLSSNIWGIKNIMGHFCNKKIHEFVWKFLTIYQQNSRNLNLYFIKSENINDSGRLRCNAYLNSEHIYLVHTYIKILTDKNLNLKVCSYGVSQLHSCHVAGNAFSTTHLLLHTYQVKGVN